MLVDAHCHLDLLSKYKDIDKVIKNANNLAVIITQGTSPESNRKVLEYSKKYKVVRSALGMYPDKAIKLSDEEIGKEIQFIRKQKPFAIGEVGLDNFRVENLERQKEVFKKFIELSNELGIPIIVHSRNAEKETLEFLEENKAKKVLMHCFSGNKELTELGLKLGYYFSIPTSIVRSKTFRKLAKRLPLDKIITETDAPYLSPLEDEQNEPCYISYSLNKIAEIKKITTEELEKIIYMNFQKLFLS